MDPYDIKKTYLTYTSSYTDTENTTIEELEKWKEANVDSYIQQLKSDIFKTTACMQN